MSPAGRASRRRSPLVWAPMLLAGALSLGGCSGGAEEGGRSPGEPRRPAERGPEATSGAPTHEARAADPSRPPAEMGVIEGAVRVGEAAAVAGAPVELGRAVTLEGPGRATVELAAGARATLWTDGTLLLAEEPDHGVWVVRGAVHVADPPGGLGSRSPLRVATPTATIELQGAGDVVVSVEATGGTTVAVLSGHVEVSSGEVDARHRLRVVEVVAGLSVRVGERVEEAVHGPARLDDAIAAARATQSAGPSSGAPAVPVVLSVAQATARLDEAMRWLEVEQRRGRDLTARHRAAVQAGRPDEAMQFQREIVGHAQTVHALRQSVLVRWERLALAARASADPHAAASEVGPRLDRLRSLLGS